MNSQSHSARAEQANSISARTKSRPAQQEGQFRQPDYLDLRGICTLAEPACDDFCVRVEAEQVWNQKCPRCGCDSKEVRPNGTRRQTVLDEPRGLKSVRIQLRRRSYKCRACGKTGLLPLDCLVERRGITRRRLDYLENESLLRPFRELAQEVGISARTVRDIFRERVTACESAFEVTAPRVLGIDGVYIEREERAILTDIERGEIINIWGTVKEELLTPTLERLHGREKVEVVVMDMAKGLRGAVKAALPDAIIVIDRYHIQRMANEAMDKVRNRLRRREGHKNQHTMCKSFLLRKHPHQLKEKEKAELEWWFSFKPELAAAYDLKERFFAIWHTYSKSDAQESYRQWRLSVPPEQKKDFQKLITAMTNWGEYIFNYFDHRYTNAFTESTNRRVKDVQREARSGSFETVKAKVIYGTIVRRRMKEARERQAKPKRSRSGKAGGILRPERPLLPARQISIQMSLF